MTRTLLACKCGPLRVRVRMRVDFNCFLEDVLVQTATENDTKRISNCRLKNKQTNRSYQLRLTEVDVSGRRLVSVMNARCWPCPVVHLTGVSIQAAQRGTCL